MKLSDFFCYQQQSFFHVSQTELFTELEPPEIMRKLLVVCVVVAICVGMATAGKKERARKERRKEGKRGKKFDL